MKSLLGEKEVCSRQTTITANKGVTFDLTIESHSNVLRIFLRSFALE